MALHSSGPDACLPQCLSGQHAGVQRSALRQLVLLCPLSMVAMMFMTKGSQEKSSCSRSTRAEDHVEAATAATPALDGSARRDAA